MEELEFKMYNRKKKQKLVSKEVQRKGRDERDSPFRSEIGDDDDEGEGFSDWIMSSFDCWVSLSNS